VQFIFTYYYSYGIIPFLHYYLSILGAKVENYAMNEAGQARLILKDESVYEGKIFGANKPIAGEVVFNTGMVGYPETLTDPSYCGQILVLTYPLVGNYGVPAYDKKNNISKLFESKKIQISGLVVSEQSESFSHWNAEKSLSDWLKEFDIPGIYGIDTRKLTRQLREHGTMLGKIELGQNNDLDFYNPDEDDLMAKVTVPAVERIGSGRKKILLIDCGCKNSIIRNLMHDDVTIIRVPYNHDFEKEEFDGILISNGPGNPAVYKDLVNKATKLLERKVPMLGICMGHQIIALAAGAKTYKLKYGHRSQNQPVKEVWGTKCYVTSQNHSYAVDTDSLPEGWLPWFENLNDGTCEGLKHRWLPFRTIQFHPEAAPGPVDTAFIFEEFIREIK
jgi:carbamoyl-phosphate synthase small subunit